MADKFLNDVGLGVLKQWIEGKFALDSDLDNLSDRVDNIVSQGGEPNVIETVKVNGTALTPDANKAVDVEVPVVEVEVKHGDVLGATIATNDGNGSISIGDSTANSLSVSISSSDATGAQISNVLATTTYVDNYVNNYGGKINKIKVNGTEQTITNKEVDIAVPTKVSDLTNDSGFQTASDVSSAISTALTSAMTYKGSVATVADLPSSGNKVGDFYNVTATGENYAWDGSAWDKVGDILDTSTLWSNQSGQSNTLLAMTTAEINAILNPSA